MLSLCEILHGPKATKPGDLRVLVHNISYLAERSSIRIYTINGKFVEVDNMHEGCLVLATRSTTLV
ncbi:hypothetical protein BDR03DRAFT_746631 [Suillus americanus]|nr:hypothetical protein BDR03DRAFT_746631 [Suillus americanus]